MPYDDDQRFRSLSMRDVAAAWIACGLVALGVSLAEPAATRVDASAAAYAGVHLAGPSGWGAPDRDPGRALDDPADAALYADATGDAACFCAMLEVAEDATSPTEAAPVTAARSRC